MLANKQFYINVNCFLIVFIIQEFCFQDKKIFYSCILEENVDKSLFPHDTLLVLWRLLE
jgi:hypothetical protein